MLLTLWTSSGEVVTEPKATEHLFNLWKDLSAKYKDVLNYWKVRCLGAETLLQHLFLLSKEILNFLIDKVEGIEISEILVSKENFIT